MKITTITMTPQALGITDACYKTILKIPVAVQKEIDETNKKTIATHDELVNYLDSSTCPTHRSYTQNKITVSDFNSGNFGADEMKFRGFIDGEDGYKLILDANGSIAIEFENWTENSAKINLLKTIINFNAQAKNKLTIAD